jgi:hypothetical protein
VSPAVHSAAAVAPANDGDELESGVVVGDELGSGRCGDPLLRN